MYLILFWYVPLFLYTPQFPPYSPGRMVIGCPFKHSLQILAEVYANPSALSYFACCKHSPNEQDTHFSFDTQVCPSLHELSLSQPASNSYGSVKLIYL